MSIMLYMAHDASRRDKSVLLVHFHKQLCKELASTKIQLDGEDTTMLEWYLLDGSIKRTAPWMILPRRPLGCQYLNTHNDPISTIFNCNSNVIIGDASNTFYLTLYGSKSTQKEDSEKKERIMKKLIRRLKRLQMERERNLIEDEDDDQG